LLKEIQALHVKINELKSKLKKETVFNAKVALNIEIKKMNDTIEKLKGAL
jgi:predicted  nucleic acid-binding Zn-ribbon protein